MPQQRARTPDALARSGANCPIARTAAILEEKSTMLVLRDVFHGVRRFDDIRAHTGIPRQVLTRRLTTLVAAGILRRRPYQEPGSRTRYEYQLTRKGADLYPVLAAIRDWGERHLTPPGQAALVLTHADCGTPVHTYLRCDAGHEITSARDVLPRDAAAGRGGPGPTGRAG